MTTTLDYDGHGDPNPCWPEGKEEYIQAMSAEAAAAPIIQALWPDDADAVLAIAEAGRHPGWAHDYDPPSAAALLVLRRGLLPLLSGGVLADLRDALLADDGRIIQGSTTAPPALPQCMGMECCGGCLLGFVAMLEGCKTVAEVGDRFAWYTVAIDSVMMEPTACRRILNWFDDSTRPRMRAVLLREIGQEIQARATLKAVP